MSRLKEYKEISIEEIKEVDEFRTFIPENNMYDKIKEDIAKNGIKVPLIVNQNYELINGYTRLKIAKELGIKKVPVAVYETTDRADEYDLLESIIEHDVTFVMTLLQAHIEDDWVRKITYVSYTSKEEPLPNGRRIDVFYKARDFKRNICLGFEVKTGNEVDEKQLREEIEGLRSVEGCEESFLILIAQEDPEYNIPYYYIPLSAFHQKINDINRIIHRIVNGFEKGV